VTSAELTMTASESAIYFVRALAGLNPIYETCGANGVADIYKCRFCHETAANSANIHHNRYTCDWRKAREIVLALKIEGVKP